MSKISNRHQVTDPLTDVSDREAVEKMNLLPLFRRVGEDRPP